MDVLLAATKFLTRTMTRSAGRDVKFEEVLAQALRTAALIKGSPELDRFAAGAHSSTQGRVCLSLPLRQAAVQGSGSSLASAGSARGPRVAIMAPPGRGYLESTLGTWLAGGIAVPLCLSHPPEQLKYFLEDAQVAVVLASAEYAGVLGSSTASTGARLHILEEKDGHSGSADVAAEVEESLRERDPESGSLIIYTSGTTGRPKGALHSHRSLHAQVAGLCSSWEWRSEDRILHALPLHHIHGIVNALYCPIAVGACVEFLPKFSPTEVWKRLQQEQDPVTVFMGVPTMYSYLLSAYDRMSAREQATAKSAASRLRLTVSGSAACPVPIMERWEALSGQKLLERYGMTETGMLLSNPYKGERRPGFVGLPLPGVEVRSKQDGELAVRGDNLFTEYWNQPEATAESFDGEGFFLTGDTGGVEGEPPYWKIMGRISTDIIKSGGYKISALQVEDALLSHPAVSGCAVLGVEDEALGEAVVAVVSSDKVSAEEVVQHAAGKLSTYQVPKQVIILDEIPRNAMGKINKKALRKELFPH